MQENTSVIEEQEIFDPIKWFDGIADSPFAKVVKKWIETFSPIENVADINLHIPVLELLFDKNGERVPRQGEPLTYYVASDAAEITVTLKDGSVHSAGHKSSTGELYKIER